VEFVRDVVDNETDQKVVKAIVDIARSLEKKTIGEGVEDASTLAALRSLGVDFAQGIYLGRPEPFAAEELDPAARGAGAQRPPSGSLRRARAARAPLRSSG
jgi:EAL domain-containing protein (putative c-di-GMP-specific phosphodiesterase class I)